MTNNDDKQPRVGVGDGYAQKGIFRQEALEHHLRGDRNEGRTLRISHRWNSIWEWFSTLRRRRIPYVQQLEATECGAACLTMALRYHGKDVHLNEVRPLLGIGRDAATALSITKAAKWFGLRSRGVHLEMDELQYLEKGSILHWEFKHFVVFDRLRRGRVEIVDPAFGKRSVSMEQFRRSFTGVALLLEPDENFQPEKAQRRGVWRYLKQILGERALLTQVIAASILIQLFALATPVLTKVIVDRVVPQSNYHLLTLVAAGLSAIVLFQALVSYARARLLLHLRTYLDTRMNTDFLEHLVNLPYAFFQQRSAGDLLMRLNSNTTIREILTSGTLSALLDGGLVSLYLIILFAISPWLAMVVFALGVAQALTFILTRRHFQQLLSRDLEVQARSQNYQVQMIAGIETLKMSAAEPRAVEHWRNLFVDVINIALARGRLSARVDSCMTILRMGAPLLILYLGVLSVLHGQMSLGTMLAFSAVATGFLSPLSSLVSSTSQLQLLKSYLERIGDVLETPAEQDPQTVSRPAQLQGHIRVENLTFRYSPMAPEVIRNVSFEIQPGQTLAIVGPSGSGKSTLAKLLLGLYQPNAGQILYDGQSLAQLNKHSVRNQFGTVPQEAYLFGATIRENISLIDPTISLDHVVRAAKLAEIHEDIARMPLGYETPLPDGGASLSGGQRQRIAIARALVHQPSLLLLDEATNELDAATESKIYGHLEGLACTKIVIAHRLSTIFNADSILVVEDGKIVEQGRHEELLRNKAKYAQLISMQLPAS